MPFRSIVVFLLGALNGFAGAMSLMATDDHSAILGHLMADPIWFDENGMQDVLAGAEWVMKFLTIQAILKQHIRRSPN
ncbi:hypothetical protein DdX_16611 [Ditylenchus destructor]|uniref:Uncharacterized protein n=1 Tax=Ditylenchus destructor TaxID=166010 RepID=A0AAD4MNN3_9BILA|nr:hypothetical protein DdX_16611 [Ditylenchus destructor]